MTALTADGSWLEGESFREGMHLASADFSMQKVGNAVRFLCKGKDMAGFPSMGEMRWRRRAAAGGNSGGLFSGDGASKYKFRVDFLQIWQIK